jgi:hypothetical protein
MAKAIHDYNTKKKITRILKHPGQHLVQTDQKRSADGSRFHHEGSVLGRRAAGVSINYHRLRTSVEQELIKVTDCEKLIEERGGLVFSKDANTSS